MPSSKDFKKFVVEQLNGENITVKPMMGEYLLYFNGVLVGGIYDDRLLVKITEGNLSYGCEKAIPYEDAKPMFSVDFIDDGQKLKEFIKKTYGSLKKEKLKCLKPKSTD